MNRITIIFLGIIFSISTYAQEEVSPELVTDRPDQTESASLVPKGHLQIETGFVFQGDEYDNVKEENWGVLTTLLRYGINEYFEVRLGSAFLQSTQSSNGTEISNVSGMAPLFVGLKFKMLEENGGVPEMAFLLTTEFPNSGAKEFSPDYNATDLRFNIEYTLTERLGLGVNLGARWNGTDAKPEGLYSLVLGYGFTDKLSAFVESYGFLPQEEMPDHRLDAGLTYLLRENLQLDVSGGLGLSEVSPDYFINAGLSWRIPR